MLVGMSHAASTTCDTIRVGGANNWYPVFIRTDDATNVYGIAPEVAAKVFRQIGVKLRILPYRPWKRMFRQMDNGNLDAVLGVYWTSERAEKYDYSDPVGKDEIAIFVRKDHQFTLKGLKDLIGRKGLRPLGGSYGETFDKFAKQNNLDIEQIPSSAKQSIMKMLVAGRTDYAVLGRYDGFAHIRSLGVVGEIVDLSWPVVTNDVHFLFSRKSPCIKLLPKVNAAIRSLREEGFLKFVEAKYLNR